MAQKINIKNLFNRFFNPTLIILFNLINVINTKSYSDPLNYNEKCEEIQISFCRDLPYNHTLLPNTFGHQSQDIARSHLREYEPLIKIKCNPHLQLFLCTLYAPFCLNNKEPILPCRNLCLLAKNGCEKYLNSDWDQKFNCSQYPLFDNQPLCIWKPDDYASIKLINKEINTVESIRDKSFKYNSTSKNLRFSCPVQFQASKKKGQFFNLNGNKYDACATPCEKLFFDSDNTSLIRIWTGIWSIICFIFSSITFLTFFIDTKRFQYPEKQILFLSMCYTFISFIYFIGFLSKDQIACSPLISDNIKNYNLAIIKSVNQGSSFNAYCTLMAMCLYYFTMAAAIWWLLLTMSWYIQIGPKWGYEGIEKKAHYYHLIAWTLPAIQTTILVSKNQIEGDQLSGVCYVGFLDQENLLVYVLLPLFFYLLIGIFFLTIAVIELYKIRLDFVSKDTERQKVLIRKIITFGTFYAASNSILIICYLYEFKNLNNWTLNWLSNSCQIKEYGIPCPNISEEEEELYKPSLGLFLIKYFVLLLPGIISCVWVWSEKTIKSWRRFYEKIMRKVFCNETDANETYI